MVKNRIGVQVVASRPDYLAVLLSSLLRQTFRGWDLVLVFQDENVIKNPLISHIISRMEWEGHRAKLVNASDVQGIGALRNVALDYDDCEVGIRIDDDSWCEPDYLELLFKVLKKTGGDVIGGTVPTMAAELQYMPIKKEFNKITEFGDISEPDSIYAYNTDSYFPVSNLRSSMMYFNEKAKKVRFPTEYDKYAGFREETDFCLRMGKCWFVPQARCWHLFATSGGTREIWNQIGTEGRNQADLMFKRKFYGTVHKR